MGCPRLLLTIPSMLTWYLQRSLMPESSPLVASRTTMVQWHRKQRNLMKVFVEAYGAQRAAVRQTEFGHFLAWELFSALPLAMFAGLDIELLKWGYTAVWSIIALEFAFLISLLLCVCVEQLTLVGLACPRKATTVNMIQGDVLLSMAGVLSSCVFLHVHECAVTGRYDEISTVSHVIHTVLVIFFMWAACAQLKKSYPHLLSSVGIYSKGIPWMLTKTAPIIIYTSGFICALGFIAMPDFFLLAETSWLMRTLLGSLFSLSFLHCLYEYAYDIDFGEDEICFFFRVSFAR